MAFVHGKNTITTIDGNVMTAFIKSSDFDLENDNHDVTHGGANDKSYQAGLGDGKFNFEGVYDDGATSPRDVCMALRGAAAFAVIRQVDGVGSGKPQETFNAVMSKWAEASPHDGMVKYKCELQISGSITITDQA